MLHHVTQRGNGRAKNFFTDDDCRYYLKLFTENCRTFNVQCLAYDLMPNHVHVILISQHELGLRKVLSATHRAYAGTLNARRKKSGHSGRAFWQCGHDSAHMMAALRSVVTPSEETWATCIPFIADAHLKASITFEKRVKS